MGDPFSAIGLVFNLGYAVHQLKEITEAVKDAPEGFAMVAIQAHSFERELDRLSSVEPRLSEHERGYLRKQANFPECASTIEELKGLLKRIKPTCGGSSNKHETER